MKTYYQVTLVLSYTEIKNYLLALEVPDDIAGSVCAYLWLLIAVVSAVVVAIAECPRRHTTV